MTAPSWAKLSNLTTERKWRDADHRRRTTTIINPQALPSIRRVSSSLLQFLGEDCATEGPIIETWPDERPVATIENKNKLIGIFTSYIENYREMLEESIDRETFIDDPEGEARRTKRLDDMQFWIGKLSDHSVKEGEELDEELTGALEDLVEVE